MIRIKIYNPVLNGLNPDIFSDFIILIDMVNSISEEFINIGYDFINNIIETECANDNIDISILNILGTPEIVNE